MTEQRAYFPKPPSTFHEEARNRLHGHDKIQQELLAVLRRRPLAGIPEGAAVHREVIGEHPLTRRGQIVGYVDAVEIVTVNLTTVANLFEIKPKIDTVFGIIRQAKSMLALAQHCLPADAYHCHIVVPHDDPLLADLRVEWPLVWAWGIQFADRCELAE